MRSTFGNGNSGGGGGSRSNRGNSRNHRGKGQQHSNQSYHERNDDRYNNYQDTNNDHHYQPHGNNGITARQQTGFGGSRMMAEDDDRYARYDDRDDRRSNSRQSYDSYHNNQPRNHHHPHQYQDNRRNGNQRRNDDNYYQENHRNRNQHQEMRRNGGQRNEVSSNEMVLANLERDRAEYADRVRKCEEELGRAQQLLRNTDAEIQRLRQVEIDRQHAEMEKKREEEEKQRIEMMNLRIAREEEVNGIEFGMRVGAPMHQINMVAMDESLSAPSESKKKKKNNKKQNTVRDGIMENLENTRASPNNDEEQTVEMTKNKAQRERMAAAKAAAAAARGDDQQGSSQTPQEPPTAEMTGMSIAPPQSAPRPPPTGHQASSSTPFPPIPTDILEPLSNIAYAKKLAPARLTNANRVELISNFYDIQTRHQIVYRYDVSCQVNIKTREANEWKRQSIELTGGPKNDACRLEKSNICVELLRLGLQAYGRLRNGTGVVHDGSTQAYFSSEIEGDTKGNTTLTMSVRSSDLPQHIQQNLKWNNIEDFTVKIEPNRTMPSFDINDYSRESGANLDDSNKDVSNFLNLLTSQKAREHGFSMFGTGKLFNMHQQPAYKQNGQELRNGIDKGIKFIENESGKGDDRLLAALLLDAKAGNFFVPQVVQKSIVERYGNMPNINWNLLHGKQAHQVKCQGWRQIKDYVNGLRIVVQTATGRRDFQCSGISLQKLKDLKAYDATGSRQVSLLDALKTTLGDDVVRKLNKELPALRVNRLKMMPGKDGNLVKFHFEQYWPIDFATIMPNQRVPISKQLEPPRPIKPTERFTRIRQLMAELNLDGDMARKNDFLKAFGVTVSPRPKRVTGVRREAPTIVFGNGKSAPIDRDRANWSSKDTRSSSGAGCDVVLVGYTGGQERVARSAMNALMQKCRSAGVQVKRFELTSVERDKKEDGQDGYTNQYTKSLMSIMDNISKQREKYVFVFIDDFASKSHSALKLFERKSGIPTLQITMKIAGELERKHVTALNIVKKLNCKLGGMNYTVKPEDYAKDHWINSSDTLIIGYDVAHPSKPNPNDAIDVASVVGFSFNGGEHPEAFVGDYHFQSPLKEQVESDILIKRIKWMLDLFSKHRKTLPKKILIIRDGVSEGQYPMVMTEELGAIKQGCQEYAEMHKKQNTFKPKFGLIIATKRHSARFGQERGNTIENISPLTIVDRGVTRQNMNEFYLCSARALQGTSKTVCYQLLHNEIGFKDLDECQALVMALSFHHQIVDQAIGLPEPVYQADEWCKRGTQLWNAYREHFNLEFKEGEHKRKIADFEDTTTKLALWSSKRLNGTRVNA